MQKQVAGSDEQDVLDFASGEDRLRRVIGDERIDEVAVVGIGGLEVGDAGGQAAAVERGFLEGARPRFIRLEFERQDIDRHAVQFQFEPAFDGCDGGIAYGGEDFVTERIDEAAAHLELRDADVAGVGTEDAQLDRFHGLL